MTTKKIAPLSVPTARYPVKVTMYTDNGEKIEFCAVSCAVAVEHAHYVADFYNKIVRIEREFFDQPGRNDWVMP